MSDPSDVMELRRRWDAHRATAFPGEARGREIHGVDLVLVDSTAAGAIQTFLTNSSLDAGGVDSLSSAIETLEEGMPLLYGDSASYFAELLAIGRSVLSTMVRNRDR
jgi:hypothetical protein